MNRKTIVPLAMAVMLAGYGLPSVAQDNKARDKKEKKEIIIRDNGQKEEKMTIVIDGEKITINGKPITEYDGDNIIIRKRNLERAIAPYAYSMPGIRVHPSPHAYSIPRSFDFSWEDGVPGKTRAQLGVKTENDEKGAKISEVVKESAAEKAGLREGDIITEVDGKKIDNAAMLSEAIGEKKPGDETSVTYQRDKKSRSVKVKLGESKAISGTFNIPVPEMEITRPHLYGFDGNREFFREFERGNRMFLKRHRLGVRIEDTEEDKGAKVLNVEEGSVAEKAGIKKEDIITSIDGKAVKDSDDAADAIRDISDKMNYSIEIIRSGNPIKIDVKIPKTLKKADL